MSDEPSNPQQAGQQGERDANNGLHPANTSNWSSDNANTYNNEYRREVNRQNGSND
jgi:hypothetical protein